MLCKRVSLIIVLLMVATCGLLAVDLKAKVGGQTLTFPQPDKFTVSQDPEESGLMDYFESDEMEALALFVKDDDMERLDLGLMPRDPLYFVLSYTPLEKMEFSASELLELIDTMGDQVEDSFNQGFSEAAEESEVGMDVFMIGINHKTDALVSYTMLMKLSLDGVNATFVGDMAIVNAGGKLIFCYGMQTYEDYLSIGNLEEKTRLWLDKVIAANPL